MFSSLSIRPTNSSDWKILGHLNYCKKLAWLAGNAENYVDNFIFAYLAIHASFVHRLAIDCSIWTLIVQLFCHRLSHTIIVAYTCFRRYVQKAKGPEITRKDTKGRERTSQIIVAYTCFRVLSPFRHTYFRQYSTLHISKW